MRLLARLTTTADVTPGQRDAMFALMDRHYANVRRDVFDADLVEKPWVILITEPASCELCGFSTQMLLDTAVNGRPIKALFSGDTIIDRSHWGDPALAHVWGRLALSLIDAHPNAELYWFLISKGYKTYRFLPLFFHEYYPRPDEPTPLWVKDVIDALASARYPDDYDAQAGVIRAGPSQYRLRQGLADVTPQRLRDADVRFFHQRNPGHDRGDELCCLAPLTRGNFTAAAYRVIGPEPVTPTIIQPDLCSHL
jgi:hypothetical protein